MCKYVKYTERELDRYYIYDRDGRLMTYCDSFERALWNCHTMLYHERIEDNVTLRFSCLNFYNNPIEMFMGDFGEGCKRFFVYFFLRGDRAKVHFFGSYTSLAGARRAFRRYDPCYTVTVFDVETGYFYEFAFDYAVNRWLCSRPFHYLDTVDHNELADNLVEIEEGVYL